MKPVFLRSNQHPVVTIQFEQYLSLYKFLRRNYGKTREGARKYIINFAEHTANHYHKGA